jgi:hypothetical protein
MRAAHPDATATRSTPRNLARELALAQHTLATTVRDAGSYAACARAFGHGL